MNQLEFDGRSLKRRAFVRNGSLYLLGAGFSTAAVSSLFADQPDRAVRFGLVTDLHYADKGPAGSRHYRETLAKLAAAAQQFHQDQPDHVVELGDFIDAADSVELEQRYLNRINKDFAALPGQQHYVLGNHCVYTLTKQEFLDGVGQQHSHYSFDAGGFHFVVLDACFRGDGQPYGRKNFEWTDPNIPMDQIEWLTADLARANGQVVVFVHQRLDLPNDNQFAVNNADQVRKVLEDSGKVLAVLQGHSHDNETRVLNGIHYCVLRAMVEGSAAVNNGYSTMDVLTDGTLRISGFCNQQDYQWS